MNQSSAARMAIQVDVLPTIQAARFLDTLLVAFMVAAALGIIYIVGLSPIHALHNAFHNVRHGSGFPCH